MRCIHIKYIANRLSLGKAELRGNVLHVTAVHIQLKITAATNSVAENEHL
jgi:hypothetical protein